MFRIKAALSHLTISLVIFTVLVTTLLLLWYPQPYFTASGGWQGLKLVAAIDLVLGPMLTLIVFNRNKSRSKLIGDLVVIAVLQLSALLWGVKTIYEQRPVAVAFWEKDFISVPAQSFYQQDIDLVELKQFGKQSPVFVYAEKPTDLTNLSKMAEIINKQGVAPHEQLNLYRPLKPSFSKILPYELNMDEILDRNAEVKADLKQILQKTGKQPDDYHYFSLQSKYHNIILMFDHNGELQQHIVVKLD